MDVALTRLITGGKYGMLNMQAWLFLASFVELRKSILSKAHVDSLLHLGPRTFDELSGEVVQNVAFVITSQPPSDKTIVYRLVEGNNCFEKNLCFNVKEKLFI